MNIKNWVVSKLDKEHAAKLAEEYSIPSFLAMLLDIRGFRSQSEISALLSGEDTLSDPFLIKDMDRAAERIRKAVDEGEKIAVYGDYDADGVTSTAMLFTYLEANGADVIFYIPEREGEGYGMNVSAVETIAQRQVKLIVTVDNGISSVEETIRAAELGMDVVITDHHRPGPVLPPACAVVDAFRQDNESPFKDFCGAGIALKLIAALEDGDCESVFEEYADLAALGTVADVVPLTGENRAIVKSGLRIIENGDRPGLAALLEYSGAGSRTLNASSLSFTVIPRINAAGRMGIADKAVQLLVCEDEEEAAGIAEEICRDNDERRKVEANIAEEAFAKIESDSKLRYDPVIVVEGENWHGGVIGIVAAKLVEYYGKPCMVVTVSGSEAKGSGRSVEGFSLFEAVSACSDLLLRFGGHPMAAGVSLKTSEIENFRTRINAYARENYPEMPAQCLRLDCKLNPSSLSCEMPESLELLEPFGTGNPQPVFGLFGMELLSVTPIGGGAHLRLTLKRDSSTVTALKFGTRADDFPYEIGAVLDLAVTLDSNVFRGEKQLSIFIKDIKLSGADTAGMLHSFRIYEKYRSQAGLAPEEAALITPDRKELAVLYRLILQRKNANFELTRLVCELGESFNLGKLLAAVDILAERGLIRGKISHERLEAEIIKTDGKVDVFASPVYKEIEAVTIK